MSNMRLRIMNGSIVMPTKVEGIVEARVKLNDKTHRLVEVAKDTKQNITGLLFHFPYENNVFCPSSEGTLFIGNLKTSVATDIICKLLSEGYADISGLDYQKESFDFEKLIFDEGAGRPYYLRGFYATMGLNFGVMPVCSMPVVEDDGEYTDDEPKSAEDMRRDIYAMSDKYTISQLANMNEDELSDILKGIESQF